MANRDKATSKRNHRRQMWWLRKGKVMLPTVKEELAIRRLVAREHARKASEATA